MRVWLDDIRPAPPGWTWTTTVEQTITALRSGRVTDLSLDYDLDETDQEHKGVEVLHWLEDELAESGRIRLPAVHWHTANPLGSFRFTLAWRRLERAHGYPWAPGVTPVGRRRRNEGGQYAELYRRWETQLDQVAPVGPKQRRDIDWRDLDNLLEAFADDSGLELLGYGAGRAVYALDDYRVIKLAMGPSGQTQSEWECYRWTHFEHPALAPIHECSRRGEWVVMARAEPMDEDEWLDIPGRDELTLQLGIEDDMPENWGRHDGRPVLVDYGDPVANPSPSPSSRSLRRRLT